MRPIVVFAAIPVAALCFAAGAINLRSPSVVTTMTSTAAPGSVRALQDQLQRQPRDAGSWSALGSAYVEQARLTGDPTFYVKADGAIAEALRLTPADPNALSSRGALNAARHDFHAALADADAALSISPASADAMLVRVDALTELGRYGEALTAARAADDLRPGVASFARLSYQFELRGNLVGAARLMQAALDASSSAADRAFALVHLGDLARISGDAGVARRSYGAALVAVPGVLGAQVGLARLDISAGNVSSALALLAEVVRRSPLPAYVGEYGDLLAATGHKTDAAAQYAVAQASVLLSTNAGVRTDLETALFAADHGDPAVALAAATREWAARHSIHVADALAWALHVNGRDVEALVYSNKALALGSRDPLFRHHHFVIVSAVAASTTSARSSS